MSTDLRALRVVIASPSDVEAERALVPLVLDELNRTIAADRGLHLDDAQWETDTYPGLHGAGAQGLIDPVLKVEDCDLLIGIFWKRFGTLTQDGTTGTEHEFYTAYQAWKKRGSPQVMVYFNQKAYTPKSKEELDQWSRVLQFRENFPKEGLWWPNRGPTQFEKLLRTHVGNFLRQGFPLVNGETEDAAESIPLGAPAVRRSDYFSVQTRAIKEHARRFVGRLSVQRDLERFMKTRDRGFFVVLGAPGQGKTAVACQLIQTHHYVHHLVSRTGVGPTLV